jgi:hypothetical protein
MSQLWFSRYYLFILPMLVFACAKTNPNKNSAPPVGQIPSPQQDQIQTYSQDKPPFTLMYSSPSLRIVADSGNSESRQKFSVNSPEDSSSFIEMEYAAKVDGVSDGASLLAYIRAHSPRLDWKEDSHFRAPAEFSASFTNPAPTGSMKKEVYLLSDTQEVFHLTYQLGTGKQAGRVSDSWNSLRINLTAPQILRITASNLRPAPGEQVDLQLEWRDDYADTITLENVDSGMSNPSAFPSWLGYDIQHTVGLPSPAYAFPLTASNLEADPKDPHLVTIGSFTVPVHSLAKDIVLAGLKITNGYRATTLSLESGKPGESKAFDPAYHVLSGRIADGLAPLRISPRLPANHVVDNDPPTVASAKFEEYHQDGSVTLDLEVHDASALPEDGRSVVEFTVEDDDHNAVPKECYSASDFSAAGDPGQYRAGLQISGCDFLNKPSQLHIRPKRIILADEVMNRLVIEDPTTLPGDPKAKIIYVP